MATTTSTATCPKCGANAIEGVPCACQSRRVLRFIQQLDCGHCSRTIAAVILAEPRAPVLVPSGLRCRWCGGQPQPGETIRQSVYPTLPRIATRVGRPPRWLQEQRRLERSAS